MDGRNGEEWGATLLGFVGFFLALGFLVLGMLPMWLLLIPLALAAAVIIGVATLARKVLTHERPG